jgi:hypothetical protein
MVLIGDSDVQFYSVPDVVRCIADLDYMVQQDVKDLCSGMLHSLLTGGTPAGTTTVPVAA